MADFKKLAEEFDRHRPEKKRLKVNRTLRLNNDDYVRLQSYCRRRGLSTSLVVDRLISEFLEHAEDAQDALEMVNDIKIS